MATVNDPNAKFSKNPSQIDFSGEPQKASDSPIDFSREAQREVEGLVPHSDSISTLVL